jgi:hypothetical protein
MLIIKLVLIKVLYHLTLSGHNKKNQQQEYRKIKNEIIIIKLLLNFTSHKFKGQLNVHHIFQNQEKLT